MPIAIRTPRINNNDDVVRFSRILSVPGSAVRKGDPVAEIETDKAIFTIEAEEDGYVLAFIQPLGETIPVGSVLAWLGSSPDERVPSANDAVNGAAMKREPTLKAALLLAKSGLSAAEIPAKGERLTAQEVLDFLHESNGRSPSPAPPTRSRQITVPLAPGENVPLTVAERAMLKHTLWHKESAVPGYVEIQYDTQPWEGYARNFQAEHKILLSPLLALMAWHLVRLAMDRPLLNSTITEGERHQYSTVNLGFTLQSETRLALLCVRDAATLSSKEFVDKLTGLMRRGMSDKLTPEDTSEVTISFSSMSRWQVTRHVPVLPPYTSLIVAHSSGSNSTAALGATYDHRVLTGGEVAAVLTLLSKPPK